MCSPCGHISTRQHRVKNQPGTAGDHRSRDHRACPPWSVTARPRRREPGPRQGKGRERPGILTYIDRAWTTRGKRGGEKNLGRDAAMNKRTQRSATPLPPLLLYHLLFLTRYLRNARTPLKKRRVSRRTGYQRQRNCAQTPLLCPQAKLSTGDTPRLLADRRLRRAPPAPPHDGARGSASSSTGRALPASTLGRTPPPPGTGATTSVTPARPTVMDHVPPRWVRAITDAATVAVTAATAAAAGRAAAAAATTRCRRAARTALRRERNDAADGDPAVTVSAVWTARSSAPKLGGGVTGRRRPSPAVTAARRRSRRSSRRRDG